MFNTPNDVRRLCLLWRLSPISYSCQYMMENLLVLLFGDLLSYLLAAHNLVCIPTQMINITLCSAHEFNILKTTHEQTHIHKSTHASPAPLPHPHIINIVKRACHNIHNRNINILQVITIQM